MSNVIVTAIYLREGLAKAEKDVKNLTSLVKYTEPGGKLNRVENNVFDFLYKLPVWNQSELDCALDSGDLSACIETIVGLDSDNSMCYDENPQFPALVALRRTILEASVLTYSVREELVSIDAKFEARAERNRRDNYENKKCIFCRRVQCCRKCKDDNDERPDSSDESSGFDCYSLARTLDALPLAKELVAEFGGNPQNECHQAKAAKIGDE